MRSACGLALLAGLGSGATIASAQDGPAIQSQVGEVFAQQEAEAAALRASFSSPAPSAIQQAAFQPPAPAPGSDGQPGTTEMNSDLRTRLENLERRVLASDEAEQAKAKPRSGVPTFKPGGQIIVDSLYFSQSTTNRLAVGDAQDTVDFRRARIYAQGEAYDVFSYAIGFDFAQSSGNNGPPVFLDNFIAMHDLPLVNHFRVGHFFEPFTLDRTSSNRNISFMERALTDTFAPARNTGFMFFNQNESQSIYWAVGGFRGGTNNNGDDAGDQQGDALTTRFVYRPYYDEPSGGRYYMHLGLGYSYRNAADGTFQYRSRPEIYGQGQDGTDDTPDFVNTGVLPAHYGQLFGTEFARCNGSFFVQSEFVCSAVNRIGGDDAFFYGAYGLVSYMLTGEHRPYNREYAILDRVIPFENVFRVRSGAGPIISGRGAWEVLARLSHIDLNDAGVNGGVLTNMTLGLNWYLTPYNRMKFNYILSQLDGVPSGTSYCSIFGLRCDMDF